MSQQERFDYEVAFSRNIGWFTEAEQARLRGCRVAVGGLGGVGGSHLLTLARLGVGQFTITDLDTLSAYRRPRGLLPQICWSSLSRNSGATRQSI